MQFLSYIMCIAKFKQVREPVCVDMLENNFWLSFAIIKYYRKCIYSLNPLSSNNILNPFCQHIPTCCFSTFSPPTPLPFPVFLPRLLM